MADGDVKYRFMADAAAAERVLAQLEKKVDSLENKLKNLSRTSKKGHDDSIAGMLRQAMTYERVSTAVQNLGSHLLNAVNHQQALQKATEATGIALDSSLRKLRIQQGLSALDSETSRKLSTGIATQAGVSQESVLRVARQLESSGFSDPLRSGSANAVIAYLQATAQDVDAAPLENIVSAMSQQLDASGQARSGGNLLKLATQFRGLFATKLEAPDLVDFAKVRGVATQLGLTQEQFLGASAVTKDVMSAPEGATGLGNFLTKLAAPKPNQLEALGMLGVKPEDVDFIGESISTVAKRLSSAVDTLPKEQRTKAMAELFGAEKSQLTAAFSLLDASRSGRLDEYIGMASDESAFEFSVREARGGPAAARGRLQAQLAEQASIGLEAGEVPVELLEIANQLETQRTRNRLRSKGADFRLRAYDTAEWMFSGLPAKWNIGEEGMQMARDAMKGDGSFSLEELKASMDRNNELMSENNRLLQQQNGNKPQIRRDAQSE